jgi:hypothetical protein
MVTMKHHHARGPEETVCDLPLLVPAERASPEAIQQQVRESKISARVATTFLAPVARINLEDCERMAAAFAQHHCDAREAGQLYAAWRGGSPAIRQRLLDEPALFL